MTSSWQISCLQIITLLAGMHWGQAFGQTSHSCSNVTCNSASGELIIFIGADRDVAGMGQLRRVTKDFCCRGYNAVYFDPNKQFKDHEALAGIIRHAVRCRGQRVMLVGWSFGTVVGLKALQIVEREGICIDTFVDLDCFNIDCYMGDDFHPRNAGRVIVVRSKLNKSVDGYYCPAVHRLSTFWHLGVPTHEHTICMLTNEADLLCGDCCGEIIPGPYSMQTAEPTRARLMLTTASLQQATVVQ